ncbi:ZIP family metal transporter [Haloglomus salinum]|jgi:ZIP family zinc transporter|uniref:ZIP family metal transporter n=1 Tax=Haloglomus salinum TaxID=2962673 RepID=UPI0020C93D01|nr:ZIP family metal transporter [Haloglomus salinum]
MATPTDTFVSLVGTDPLVQGLVGGIVIAALNTLGAAAILVVRDPSERTLDGLMGFAAGVMLSASFTSLLLPGIDFAEQPAYQATIAGVTLGGVVPVLVGFVLGVLLLDRGEEFAPEIGEVITGRAGRDVDVDQARVSAVVLFIFAITLHNMPEGLAVGVGFGSGNVGDGIALMLAIGIQNIPEGLAVSISARDAGLGSSFYAVVAGVRAGVVEIPLAVFGAIAVSVAAPLLPYAMGFAAGGMLFVISHEIVPSTHARGNEHVATMGLMAGLAVMLTLDVVLA